MSFPILGISYKGNHTIYYISVLASFIWKYILKWYPYCSIYQYSICFCSQIKFCIMNKPCFDHSWWLWILLLWTLVCMSFWMNTFFYFIQYIPRSGIAWSDLHLTPEEMPNYFPKQLHHFTFVPTIYMRVSISSHPGRHSPLSLFVCLLCIITAILVSLFVLHFPNG